MDQRIVTDPIIRIRLALDHMESLLSRKVVGNCSAIQDHAAKELELDKREAFYDLQTAVTYLDQHIEREASGAAMASEIQSIQSTGQA